MAVPRLSVLGPALVTSTYSSLVGFYERVSHSAYTLLTSGYSLKYS